MPTNVGQSPEHKGVTSEGEQCNIAMNNSPSYTSFLLSLPRPLMVGFVGCPGSGKTTLARQFAGCARDALGVQRVEYVDEYARRALAKPASLIGIHDQMRILNKQLERETSFFSTSDLISTDSPIHLGFFYAREYANKTAKDVQILNDLFKQMNALNQNGWYDVVFHLPPVLKPVDDGVRAAHQLQDEWRTVADRRLYAVFDLVFPPKQLVVLDDVALSPFVQADPAGSAPGRDALNAARLQAVVATVRPLAEQRGFKINAVPPAAPVVDGD